MCIYELLQHDQQQNFLVEYWVGGVLVFGFFFGGGGGGGGGVCLVHVLHFIDLDKYPIPGLDQ